MALHGRTKIELTDVHTGKVETIEKNNFITKGAEMYLKPIGALWNNDDIYFGSLRDVYSTNYLRALQFLYGTCLLFDTPISGDENTVFPGAENAFLGGADYGVANATTNNFVGSYNSVESVYDPENRTATMVFDFTTNQCNGNIGAVCLAPIYNASVGAFGIDDKFQSPVSSYKGEQCYTIATSTAGSTSMKGKQYTTLYNEVTNRLNPIALNTSENYGWYFNCTSKSVEKIGIPITRQSLFVQNYLWQGTVLESHAITFPDGITVVLWGNCGMYDDENCWVYGYDSTNIYMFVINLTTGAITKTVSIVNPGTGTYGATKYIVDTMSGVFYSHGYCLIDFYIASPSQTKCYRVNENNPTDISLAEISDRSGASLIIGLNGIQFDLNGRVYIGKNVSYTDGLYGVWDVETNKVTNRKSIYSPLDAYSTNYAYARDIKNPLLLFSRANNDTGAASNVAFMSRSLTFLSTINNLDEIVTKTSDKTMKITYTLTEVAEE